MQYNSNSDQTQVKVYVSTHPESRFPVKDSNDGVLSQVPFLIPSANISQNCPGFQDLETTDNDLDPCFFYLTVHASTSTHFTLVLKQFDAAMQLFDGVALHDIVPTNDKGKHYYFVLPEFQDSLNIIESSYDAPLVIYIDIINHDTYPLPSKFNFPSPTHY